MSKEDDHFHNSLQLALASQATLDLDFDEPRRNNYYGLTSDEYSTLSSSCGELQLVLRKFLANYLQVEYNRTKPWENLTGRKVFDIACGGGDGYPQTGMPVLLGGNGVDFHGTDIAPQDPRLQSYYTHHQADLLDLITASNPWEVLPNLEEHQGSFDVVTSTHFIGLEPSPLLQTSLRARGDIFLLQILQLREPLLHLSHKLLKPGGVAILEFPMNNCKYQAFVKDSESEVLRHEASFVNMSF